MALESFQRNGITVPPFVGDLSKNDAAVLVKYASRASSILEFGSGGSTGIMSAVRPPDSKFWSVETEPYWVQTTKDNIAKFGGVGPEFLTWEEWEAQIPTEPTYDLAFCDGADFLRRKFMVQVFPVLKVGGWLLAHDQRRLPDADNVLSVIRDHFLEVETIHMNESGSNITAIRKKVKEEYVNWQTSDD